MPDYPVRTERGIIVRKRVARFFQKIIVRVGDAGIRRISEFERLVCTSGDGEKNKCEGENFFSEK